MKHRILTMMMLLALSIVALAQEERTITGTVTDETGEPMIGATVKPAGSQGGTITDIDGNYTLKIGNSVKQLTVSYIGYTSVTVTIKGDKIDVVMKEDKNVLEELVVVGYGSVKKGDVTNAVAQIKGDDLADRPVSNIASALQGELAGVEIRTTSGAPGSGVQDRKSVV